MLPGTKQGRFSVELTTATAGTGLGKDSKIVAAVAGPTRLDNLLNSGCLISKPQLFFALPIDPITQPENPEQATEKTAPDQADERIPQEQSHCP